MSCKDNIIKETKRQNENTDKYEQKRWPTWEIKKCRKKECGTITVWGKMEQYS